MKKLVISPSNLHLILLKRFRKENPFFDVKFLTKNQLLNLRYGYINNKEKAIKLFMLNFGLTYNTAESILGFILFIPQFDGEFSRYSAYIDLLKTEDLISFSEYGDEIFKGKDIEIIGYSSFDKELITTLDYFGLTYHFYKYDNKLEPVITSFKTFEESVFHILNAISYRINRGEDINKFVIVSNDGLYNFYLQKYAPSFHLPLNIKSNDSLLFNQFSVELLNIFKNKGDIHDILNVYNESFDETQLAIFSIFKDYFDSQFNKEQQIDYWKGILKNISSSQVIYKDAVTISNNMIFDDSKVIFVPLFIQGKFPSTFKDNDYLSDEEKAICSINTSIDKGRMSDDLCQQFLFSNKQIFLSYPSNSYKETFYPSPFIKINNWSIKKYELTKQFFSKDMLDFHTTNLIDRNIIYKESNKDYISLKYHNPIPYSTYTNRMDPVLVYDQSQYLNYSYSKIKSYYLCPFSFYLGNVLKLDTFEGNFNSNLGSFIHSIFEHQFDVGFDFDKFYFEEQKEYNFTKREIAIINSLRNKIFEAYKANQLHIEYMKDPSFKTELSCNVNITNKSKLVGKVDKVIVTDNSYVYLVDYKTGSETFYPQLVDYGLSLQLPTYAYLTNGLGVFNYMPIKGLFINSIIDPSFSVEIKDDQYINKKLRLSGIVVGDDSLETFDTFTDKGRGQFVSGIKKEKSGGFSGSSVVTQSEIDTLKDRAKQLYINADACIRHNDFQIEPKVVEGKVNACEFCSFKDICFVKENQIKRIKVEKENE